MKKQLKTSKKILYSSTATQKSIDQSNVVLKKVMIQMNKSKYKY